MTDTTYNGWTNYATWRVNLELIDAIDMSDVMTDELNAADFAEYLREYVEDILSCTAQGFALDYALSFVADVNWREIAKNKLGQYETDYAA